MDRKNRNRKFFEVDKKNEEEAVFPSIPRRSISGSIVIDELIRDRSIRERGRASYFVEIMPVGKHRDFICLLAG